MSKKITAVERPFHLTFTASGTTYPLSSIEAQRLIDEYPAVSATRNKVVLRGDDGTKSVLTPATLGGGPAFEIHDPNKKKTEKEEAIDRLRELVKPGDVVKTILRHVSRSGMSRSISPVIDGEDVSYLVARALGDKVDQNHGGVKMGGAGMDMGFALVHNLSYALYPTYICTGKDGYGKDRCPSADHVNPQRDPETGERSGPPLRPDGEMIHKDGYALQQEWL